MGPADHKCDEGMATIATQKLRDRHDLVIIQEKVDGSNVGVAKINRKIVPLTRAGYLADTSPFEQHHFFAKWVSLPNQQKRFNDLLIEGERVCGEWLLQTHGTRYILQHEPFVPFDIIYGSVRTPWEEFRRRIIKNDFVLPNTIHIGGPLSIEDAMDKLQISGHGAIDPVEGAVWRVERDRLKNNNSSERNHVVDFLVKYVRPDKRDGIYLPEVSGRQAIYNLPLESLGI